MKRHEDERQGSVSMEWIPWGVVRNVILDAVKREGMDHRRHKHRAMKNPESMEDIILAHDAGVRKKAMQDLLWELWTEKETKEEEK